MEQDPDSPPTFWFQPPATTNRRRTPPVDPVVLIILLPILALLFLFFFLPPFLSHASHILKPGSVKSTWDSLNIFLVLFAILCGVLARRNDDVSSSGDLGGQANGFVAMSRNSVESSGQWDGFSDRKMVVTGGLRRSSNSYPDLRQGSLRDNGENRNRFLDDFHVDMYSSPVSRYYGNLSRRIERDSENLYQSTPVSGEIRHRSRRSEMDGGEFSDVKEIVVDTFEVSPNVPDFREQTPVTPPPPPPPPPPPSAPSANSRRHSFKSVGRNVKAEIPTKTESDELVKERSHHPPPPPPPPPPPLPPAPTEVKLQRSHYKHKKLERKVSDATKEIATAISSLYSQRKRKNKRKLRNYSGSSDTSPPSVHSTPSTDLEEPRQSLVPQPPPPPPPPSMFHNLFKKGGKHKRIHSVPATASPTVPPPPPPPPPNSIFNNLFNTKSKRFHSPSTDPPLPPPLPPSSIMNSLFKNGTKSKRFNSTTVTSSPPPPPPPPPPPMTPPRYTVHVKPKQVSKRKSQAQPPTPPSPPTSEPRYRRSTSKGKPPLPTKASSYYNREDFVPSGSQSPLIPMPPPPPPFRVPSMLFELRGDFVRIRSTHSSVCSSPDRDDIDLSVMDGGDSTGPSSGPGPLFFPSPDVNAKADSFISRLRDEWRMEKIHATKEKMG